MQSNTSAGVHSDLKACLCELRQVCFLHSFRSFFFRPVPYSIHSFLNVSVRHYGVLVKAAFSESSETVVAVHWTLYTLVVLCFHAKLLKEDDHKGLDILCAIG
jgi:hypothetical protein